MILIDWITSASCKIKVVSRGGEHLWHKHFKRFEFGFSFECGFGRQLFNTHMGIYECLVSAQLESARHLAKKRVEPKRATPKNRHRNMAGSSSSAALENLATVWRLLNGAGRSSNSLDAPPAVPATPPPFLAPSNNPFNSRCPDSCFKCFVSGSLVFLAYEKCRLGDVFMVNDLCLAARSVKVIEWEMLSAARAGAGRGKGNSNVVPWTVCSSSRETCLADPAMLLAASKTTTCGKCN